MPKPTCSAKAMRGAQMARTGAPPMEVAMGYEDGKAQAVVPRRSAHPRLEPSGSRNSSHCSCSQTCKPRSRTCPKTAICTSTDRAIRASLTTSIEPPRPLLLLKSAANEAIVGDEPRRVCSAREVRASGGTSAAPADLSTMATKRKTMDKTSRSGEGLDLVGGEIEPPA